MTLVKKGLLPFALWILLSVMVKPASAGDAPINKTGVEKGTPEPEAELAARLQQALEAQGPNYHARTEHLLPSGEPAFTNRLIFESSPYLLQHAHNPVNWYPWGEAAFAAARAQDKPIFLSIGYATCHWCHVMARESFEDLSIAAVLNRDFIAVKVDRQQLPDVDALYMSALKQINGSGGWPMSTFLDAAGRPFHSGMYYPPEAFAALLEGINSQWREERETLQIQASKVIEEIRRSTRLRQVASDFGSAELRKASERVLSEYDPRHGGFGSAPKFPREPKLLFLLDQLQRDSDKAIGAALDHTLMAMAMGGIHDHVGGGFHRYTIDSAWRVPHFEKMLYNQAALARIYAKAAHLLENPWYARTARRTLDYVLRELRTEAGLFFSATDAESEGVEGRFFAWTPEQFEQVLGPDEGRRAQRFWSVDGEGSFEGEQILALSASLKELGSEFDLNETQLEATLDRWSAALLDARQLREKPFLDDKLITAWNAMMITALSEASEWLDEERYLDAAEQAATALLSLLVDERGQLHRSRRGGRLGVLATQPDYAYLAEAVLALYDRTAQPQWLQHAERLVAEMHSLFFDPTSGTWFMGRAEIDGAPLAVRPKSLRDNSIMASGNAVGLRVLSRLARRTGNGQYDEWAEALSAALTSLVIDSPGDHDAFLLAINEIRHGESSFRRYGAHGKLKATARVDGEQLRVDMALQPGWHINADKPLQDYLVPTRLLDESGMLIDDDALFPEPVRRVLGFQRSALSVYEGEFSIALPLAALGSEARRSKVRLQYQACSDQICLAPETLEMVVLNAPPEFK